MEWGGVQFSVDWWAWELLGWCFEKELEDMRAISYMNISRAGRRAGSEVGRLLILVIQFFMTEKKSQQKEH